MAIMNLVSRSFPMAAGLTDADRKIGTISSDVERNTASRVPTLMTPPE